MNSETPLSAQSRHAFRRYELLIEYKHLRSACPGGMYVIPAQEDVSTWYGVVFVDDGPYAGGVFRFVVSIPEEYPQHVPAVRFTSVHVSKQKLRYEFLQLGHVSSTHWIFGIVCNTAQV